MHMRILWLSIIIMALTGCGDDGVELKDGPFLLIDRNTLFFDTEFRSGTYIGASTFNALYIENQGDEPLEITEVTKTAPSEFAVTLPTELAESRTLRLESLKRAFIEVKFTPTQARPYEGKITIKSNAKNAAQQDIQFIACGITNGQPRPTNCYSPP